MGFKEEVFDRSAYRLQSTVPQDVLSAPGYRVRGTQNDDELAYPSVRLVGLRTLREISVFYDHAQKRLAWVLAERHRPFLGPRHLVADGSGAVVGYIRPRYLSLRRTWEALDPQGIVLWKVQAEHGLIVSRMPSSYGFAFLLGDVVAGRIKGESNFFDHTTRMTLDLTGDPRKAVDRRLALAAAFLIDSTLPRYQGTA